MELENKALVRSQSIPLC